MFSLVLFLHLRYLTFSSLTLSSIIRKKPYLPKIVRLADLCTLRRINNRATNILNRIGVPNEFCLKSSTILALSTMHLENIQIVIGINKENPTRGHAWVERDSIIISSDSHFSIQRYSIIKRIDFRN